VYPKDGRLDAVRFFSLQTSIVTTLLPPSQFGGLLKLWPALRELLRTEFELLRPRQLWRRSAITAMLYLPHQQRPRRTLRHSRWRIDQAGLARSAKSMPKARSLQKQKWLWFQVAVAATLRIVLLEARPVCGTWQLRQVL